MIIHEHGGTPYTTAFRDLEKATEHGAPRLVSTVLQRVLTLNGHKIG